MNKPYQSNSLSKKKTPTINDKEEINEKLDMSEENKQLEGTWLVQSIPVLNMKKKQIPGLEAISSINLSRYETLVSPKAGELSTLETPVNRQKILLKNNWNSDVGIKNIYNEMMKQDSK